MRLEGQRILVTGGAGFIGSHLVELLAPENEVVVIDDFSTGRRENLSAAEREHGLRVVEADVRDRDRMLELARGVDVIFHLAISCLRTSLARPFLSHDVNGGGTLALCVAALEHGVKRFVYCSSSEVYGTALSAPMTEEHPTHPTTVYGASKLVGEHYALAHWRTYGLPVVVVRPFNTYGPREPWEGARAEVIPRFALLLKSGRQPVVYGDGSQTRDFTFVEDTARGIAGAGACDALVGEAVNVAYGREASISEVAELLMELTGTHAVGLRRAEPRPGDVQRHYADAAKAKRAYGFEARTDLRTGLRRYLEWFDAERLLERASLEAAARPNW